MNGDCACGRSSREADSQPRWVALAWGRLPMCAFIKRLTYWWVISIVIGIITATTQNEGDSTSQYLASYVSCQRDTARICCCGRRCWSIISCLHGAQLQTRHTPRLRSNDETDRQRDRRTDTRPFHKPCSSYYESTVDSPTSQRSSCWRLRFYWL